MTRTLEGVEYWDCPNHDYDETWDADTNEETQYWDCRLGYDAPDSARCDDCPRRPGGVGSL